MREIEDSCVSFASGNEFLTLLYMAFLSLRDYDTRFVHFWVQGHEVYPCDEVEMKNGPKEMLLTELCGFS